MTYAAAFLFAVITYTGVFAEKYVFCSATITNTGGVDTQVYTEVLRGDPGSEDYFKTRLNDVIARNYGVSGELIRCYARRRRDEAVLVRSRLMEMGARHKRVATIGGLR